jgi:hypothetical protein
MSSFACPVGGVKGDVPLLAGPTLENTNPINLIIPQYKDVFLPF